WFGTLISLEPQTCQAKIGLAGHPLDDVHLDHMRIFGASQGHQPRVLLQEALPAAYRRASSSRVHAGISSLAKIALTSANGQLIIRPTARRRDALTCLCLPAFPPWGEGQERPAQIPGWQRM